MFERCIKFEVSPITFLSYYSWLWVFVPSFSDATEMREKKLTKLMFYRYLLDFPKARVNSRKVHSIRTTYMRLAVDRAGSSGNTP